MAQSPVRARQNVSVRGKVSARMPGPHQPSWGSDVHAAHKPVGPEYGRGVRAAPVSVAASRAQMLSSCAAVLSAGFSNANSVDNRSPQPCSLCCAPLVKLRPASSSMCCMRGCGQAQPAAPALIGHTCSVW